MHGKTVVTTPNTQYLIHFTRVYWRTLICQGHSDTNVGHRDMVRHFFYTNGSTPLVLLGLLSLVVHTVHSPLGRLEFV